MYIDANLVRDATRRELSQREQEMNESRAKREAEKQRLDQEAEERRKQYDLIEKRLRLASANDQASGAGWCQLLCITISTDVIVLNHVRFLVFTRDFCRRTEFRRNQGARVYIRGGHEQDPGRHRGHGTQENLKRLQQENTDLLTRLREVCC